MIAKMSSKRFWWILIALLFLSSIVAVLALRAQGATPPAGTGAAGTPHGISLSWTAASQGSDTNAIAGYNVYRDTGTCASITWPSSPTPINSALVTGTTYLDPASGLSAGTSYCYGVATQDSVGNQSAFATVTVAVPSAGFPVNPGTPGSLAGAVQ